MEVQICPRCREPLPVVNAKFCENCGKILKPILAAIIFIGYGMALGALLSPYLAFAGFVIGLILLTKPDRFNGAVIISLAVSLRAAGFLIEFLFE